jgi:hypothetical protein
MFNKIIQDKGYKTFGVYADIVSSISLECFWTAQNHHTAKDLPRYGAVNTTRALKFDNCLAFCNPVKCTSTN